MLASLEWSALDTKGEGPWFALRTRGRADAKVIPHLTDLGISTYYPMVREIRRVPLRELSLHKRRSSNAIMRPRKVPLLPSTVFVSERVHDLYDRVFELSKVIGFLTVGGEPARIPSAVLEELRAREIDGAIAGATPARLIFKQGDRVRVVDGPLTMVEGTITRIPDVTLSDIDEDTILQIMVAPLGKVTLPAGYVEKIR